MNGLATMAGDIRASKGDSWAQTGACWVATRGNFTWGWLVQGGDCVPCKNFLMLIFGSRRLSWWLENERLL